MSGGGARGGDADGGVETVGADIMQDRVPTDGRSSAAAAAGDAGSGCGGSAALGGGAAAATVVAAAAAAGDVGNSPAKKAVTAIES